jgi:hypothetical protein
MAVLNYESAKKELPQSSDATVIGASQLGINIFTGNQLSWIVRILPYIEQQAVYQQFDFKKQFDVYKNENVPGQSTPEQAQPASLLCPSDSGQGRVYQSPRYTGSRTFGKGNYGAYGSAEHAECELAAPGMLINFPQPLKRVEDGTTNTIMLAELRTREEPQDQRGAWAIAWPGTSILAADVHATTQSLRICSQTSPPSYIPNPAWAVFALTPNKPVPVLPDEPRDDLRQCIDSAQADIEGMPCWTRGDTTVAPRSLHPGGVYAANGDGSVRWIADEIQAAPFGSLICINDGAISNP